GGSHSSVLPGMPIRVSRFVPAARRGLAGPSGATRVLFRQVPFERSTDHVRQLPAVVGARRRVLGVRTAGGRVGPPPPVRRLHPLLAGARRRARPRGEAPHADAPGERTPLKVAGTLRVPGPARGACGLLGAPRGASERLSKRTSPVTPTGLGTDA